MSSCADQDQKSLSIDNLNVLRNVDTTAQKLYFLQMEEQFWRQRIELADKDSINLILDLVENKIIIEIRGVPLRICSYDMLIKDLRRRGEKLTAWCSVPFRLEREDSSIPKEPVRIRRLPEETSKIEEGYNLEFLEENDPVFIRLFFERSLVIEMIERGIVIPDSMRLQTTTTDWLRFGMERSDLVAIFRALPSRAQMLLRPGSSSF